MVQMTISLHWGAVNGSTSLETKRNLYILQVYDWHVTLKNAITKSNWAALGIYREFSNLKQNFVLPLQ